MIKNIVILGAGAMGSGIAQINLMAGYNVTLVDIKDEFIEKGMDKIKFGLGKLAEKGKLKGRTADGIISLVRTSTEIAEAVKDADLVLEAVVEELTIKKNVFKTVGEHAPEHCIIASNTSSMSIKSMAEASKRPDKVCGVHFFNPAPLMRLVEVIKCKYSSDETIKSAVAWAYSLPCLRGKRYVPIVLKDKPGFIANRIQAPIAIVMNWALDYAQENKIPCEHVDNDLFIPIAPMSPFILLDHVGLDISYMSSKYYATTLHDDFIPGKVITEKFKAKVLGRKTGKGLYDWSEGIPLPDRTHKAGLLNLELIGAIQANEGCRLLEEGVVKDWSTIDKTMEAGFNTPGPMQFLVDGNRERWPKLLEDFAEKTGKAYLKPCELMKSGKYREMQYLS
jgi:enoyl-CoA hydratase/3-hydroxyacyl-CoA dehydrogenase